MSYIMACIHLPLEVFPDGSYKPINDIANITFEKCDELPKTSNLSSINLDEIFNNLCKKQEVCLDTERPYATVSHPPMLETLCADGTRPSTLMRNGSDENLRFPRIHSKNITFRNSRTRTNFTRRVYR